MPIERRVAQWISRLLLALGGLVWLAGAGAQTFESVLAPGPVIEGHVKVEHDCKACHVPFDRAAQDGLCVTCHKEVGQDLRARTGWHGRREPQACRSCHAEHRGRDAKLANFETKGFDHRQTDFELRDKHVGVECTKCHVAGKRWREAPSNCVGCHTKDDVHKGGLGRRCEDCHAARSWKEVDFDHGRKTRFALTGKHETAKCDTCHAQGRYKDTPRACVGCHRKDDDEKGHRGQYGDKCETCHTAKAWKPSTFQHDTDTRYQLKDKHRLARCAACHTGPLYRTKLGTACADCHTKDDKHHGTLGPKCESCHSERGWTAVPDFDHQKSRFPLLGAHAKVLCKDCHRDALYRQTPDRCIDCHRKDDRHERTLGENCADCHQERDWKTVAGRFDHQRTKFALRNAHAASKVKCQDCHETLRQFRATAMECIACHRRDDKHEATLGERCQSCHDDTAWRVERFDHARSRFALAGRHLIVPCKSCHLSLRFKEAPGDCLGCHRKDDAHKATLGAQCDACHNVRAWPLWTFDHDLATHYPLELSHRRVSCLACHTKPAPAAKAVAELPTDCLSCHRKNDIHEGRFGRRCEQCHVPDRWPVIRRR